MSAQLWQSWGDLTRLLESSRLAFVTETERASAGAKGDLKVPINPDGRYAVQTEQHRETLTNTQTFYRAILVMTYSLAEAAALDALGLKKLDGGIDAWAGALLGKAGKSFDDVPCRAAPSLRLWDIPLPDDGAKMPYMNGRCALLEVAVVRNLIIHNDFRVNEKAVNTVEAHPAQGAPAVEQGQQLSLSVDDLRNFRGRLQTLLNVAGLQQDPTAYVPPRSSTAN